MTNGHPVAGEPMTARDALNYYFETDRTPGSIVHGLVVDAVASDHPVRTHDDAVFFARGILDLHPLFRRRLHTVTANLSFPLWVDCDVTVADHVFVHHAHGDDDHDFLRRRVIDASRTPFDFGAPAWQLHFVTDLHGVPGVPAGGTVMLFKVHHSAIDGMGTTDLVHRMLAPAGTDTAGFDADSYRRTITPIPSTWSAARTLPKGLLRLGRAALARARAMRRLDPADRPVAHKYPATRFNTNTTPDMSFDLTWFELDLIRRIKSSVEGATVNDVIMTIVSLAISEYLGHDMPEHTLGASFPVNVRPISSGGDTANQLAIAVVDLATDVADPMDRLVAVSGAARERKAELARRVALLPPH
ncbi:MAG: wax ester/triacylglycerol synthase domain-containing protein, partial [Rhodococcus sp. (in: high G+C Gram-positive bacteria)]